MQPSLWTAIEKPVRMTTLVMVALGWTMTVCVGVTTFIYGFYLQDEGVREGFPSLLRLTTLFALWAVLASLAAWAAHRRQQPWPYAGFWVALPALLGWLYVEIAR